MSDSGDWRRDRKSRKPGGTRDPFEGGEWSAPPPPAYDAAPPQRRSSAPSGSESAAVVKRFDPERGFGFVALEGGSGDAFLHISALQRAGADAVTPGTRLRVRVGGGERGPQVTEVLEVGEAGEAAPVARSAHPTFRDAAPAGAGEELRGAGKW